MRVVGLALALIAAFGARADSAEDRLRALQAERAALEQKINELEATQRRRSGKVGAVEGAVKLSNAGGVAWVYVSDVNGGLVDTAVDIRQEKGRFVPGWRVVRAGTAIDFPNMDTFYHHVFSPTSGQRFDNGLYRAGERSKTHRFVEPGIVDIFCNLHQHMHAEVLVVPSEHFTQVKADGTFSLDAPIGKRQLVFWSPGMTPVTREVKVRARKTTKLGVVKIEAPRESTHQRLDGSAYTAK